MVMGAIPAAIALSALWLQDAISTIISFAAVGIYISFQMIVLAALIARARGWRPAGPFTLGAWGLPVNVLALAYGVSAIGQHPLAAQARTTPWYVDWAMLVMTIGVVVLGGIYMVAAKPYEHGSAPRGGCASIGGRSALRRPTRPALRAIGDGQHSRPSLPHLLPNRPQCRCSLTS